MPNSLAYLILALWPLICLVMFRRMPRERAIIWSILGGYMFLPPIAVFDVPLLTLDKFAIASIAPWFICVFVLKEEVNLWPRSTLIRLAMVVFVLSVVPTAMFNGDPLFFSGGAFGQPVPPIPGLGVKDMILTVAARIVVLLPYLLARQYLANAKALRELLIALAIAGVVYSIPALIEIRFSPQINVWVYGFFQHSFDQMMRAGGFRPIVFMPHGLWVALFFFSTVLAAAALSRDSRNARGVFRALTAYLAVILVLCKSYAAIIYGLLLTPIALLTSAKTQLRVAIILAIVASSYPMLRNASLLPLDAIVSQAAAISADRARSLEFRFDNEEMLIARAQEKPGFGWGSWGRNLVRDRATGESITVTDSRWIILFGTNGWVGYVAETSLFALPLILLGWRRRTLPDGAMSPYASAVGLIVAATMVDLLVNDTLVPFTWLCGGAVLGHAEQMSPQKAESSQQSLASREPAGNRGRRPQKRRRTIL
ncbi:hypothetical protein [Pontibaca salina]|uniref:O-antigen ligase domain-containing protein n=1 Tax=Pontibaca salina TaxID=2795731 RepID=A0A934HNF1_9RHOB|nr:hypothetical protein [Pontibaca salina]MBI6630196.1 hypothetical protein [Pontibaca salina]